MHKRKALFIYLPYQTNLILSKDLAVIALPAQNPSKRQISNDGSKFAYKGLPPMKSDHLRTSPGIPSFRGSLAFMHLAKSSAVWI